MEEKIKIYIPKSVNNILLNDMERFEILKKDGSLNKNEFYNTLIVNYYEQFQENQSDFFSYIRNTISDNIQTTKLVASDVASNILKYVDNRNFQLDNQKLNIAISFKPTKKSSETIEFIQDYYIVDSTLSSYFRNMFASYALLPQDKREKIIFKKNFELIEEAITNNKKIYFTTINNSRRHIASPFSIANAKEELFNYLLAEYNNCPFSYRISRLKNIAVINEPRMFDKNNIDIFKKMEKHGPQFAYRLDEGDEIQIRLTEEGKKLYKNSYVHRPQYTRIEGNDYFFECSHMQALNYFSRFGENAIVISPESLKNKLYEYYTKAFNAYEEFC